MGDVRRTMTSLAPLQRRRIRTIGAVAFAFAVSLSAHEPSGLKWVEIDKTRQKLKAFEGERVILESRFSTGRWDKSTPNGQFSVSAKYPMH